MTAGPSFAKACRGEQAVVHDKLEVVGLESGPTHNPSLNNAEGTLLKQPGKKPI
jgi:hypothetical protein